MCRSAGLSDHNIGAEWSLSNLQGDYIYKLYSSRGTENYYCSLRKNFHSALNECVNHHMVGLIQALGKVKDRGLTPSVFLTFVSAISLK